MAQVMGLISGIILLGQLSYTVLFLTEHCRGSFLDRKGRAHSTRILLTWLSGLCIQPRVILSGIAWSTLVG